MESRREATQPRLKLTYCAAWNGTLKAIFGYIQSGLRSSIAGATGSEILGDVMLVLKSMKGKYSSELRKEINECLEFALTHRSIFGLDGR